MTQVRRPGLVHGRLAALDPSWQGSAVEREPVESRVIRSIGYRDSDQTLEIEFASGRVYQYSGVARSLYQWLLRSPSKGGIFNRMIRDRYPELDVTPVQEQDLEAALRASLRPESGE